MSEDQAGQTPTADLRVSTGNDAYVTGTGNITIYSPDGASDGDELEALNASGGADLLDEWCTADKTLRRARLALVAVPVETAASALAQLNQSLAAALLGSINEARAKSIVDAIDLGPALSRVPTAAEAIAKCAKLAGRDLGGRTGWFSLVESGRGTQGFLQRYAHGDIHWNPRNGAIATIGKIAQYHRDAGGAEGTLGFPVAAAIDGSHPRTQTGCTWQLFEGPFDYSLEVCDYLEEKCGATIVHSAKHGTYATWGTIGEFSELGWRDLDWMGLPVSDDVQAGPSPQGTLGRRQYFESGIVYASEKAGAIRVPRRWAGYLEGTTGGVERTGFPVSPELPAASPYGTKGSFQRFEGTSDYPDDIVGHWSARERPGGATIYHSGKHGPHIVEGAAGVLFERLNGTASWLGFPTTDGIRHALGHFVQQYEGGAIFTSPSDNSVAVRRQVLDYLEQPPKLFERLGPPVREEEPLASGNGSYIQVFQWGVVMSRDGEIRAWVDPGIRSIDGVHNRLGKIIDHEGNQDVVERITVYRIIADRCAQFLRLSLNLVYPAVLALCGEGDANLLDNVGESDQKVLSSLGGVLLKASVAYDKLEVGKPAGKRTVYVYFSDVNTKQVHEQKHISELPWEDLPADVREVLRHQQRTVVFTLFPIDGQ